MGLSKYSYIIKLCNRTGEYMYFWSTEYRRLKLKRKLKPKYFIITIY